MRKYKGFYLPTILLLGLVACTVITGTIGKGMQPLVETVQAKKDYLRFETEVEGVILDERREKEQLVEICCDFLQAREILGQGSEICASFLELIPGTSTVMQENIYYGRLCEWEPKDGQYRIVVGFPVEEQQAGYPVKILVTRREGPYLVLPASAVGGDEEGAYVMDLVSSDSMWGESKIVQRHPVTIEKTSEGKVAVTGISTDSFGNAKGKLAKKIEGLKDGETVREGGEG